MNNEEIKKELPKNTILLVWVINNLYTGATEEDINELFKITNQKTISDTEFWKLTKANKCVAVKK